MKLQETVQANVNKYFFFLFTASLIFVILFYKVIGFQFTDEILVMTLFGLFLYTILQTPNWQFNKVFLFTLFVFFFYTCYSIWIGSNTKRGIFNDLIIQLKPFLSFFCAYQLMPIFGKLQKKLLKEIALLFWFIWLLPIGLVSIINPQVFILLFEHPVYYGIAVTIVALCYFLCSEYSWRSRIVFLLLLSIGILCGRSKFYGFYAMAFFIVLFFSNLKEFKFSLRNILLVLSMVGAIILVAWNKITFYFLNALSNSPDIEEDMIARLVLYRTAPEIFLDYIPFGSGFASFATFSSGEYYSQIYEKYAIDHVWGLSKHYHSFISDTFYPSLAQFGIVGVILFIAFWIYILRKAFVFFKQAPDLSAKHLIIVVLIVGFITIENTTGSTFIAQGGLFVMMILGMVLADMKRLAGKASAPGLTPGE